MFLSSYRNTSSPKLSQVFLQLDRTWKMCLLFLLENTLTKKGKQLVNFDYQNVNSLCLHHYYVNSLC